MGTKLVTDDTSNAFNITTTCSHFCPIPKYNNWFREFMTGDKFLTCSNYVLSEKQIVNTSFWFCNFTLLLLHKFCNPHKHFLLISQIIETLTTTVPEVVLYLTYFSRYSDDFAVIVLHGSFGNSQGVPDSCFHFIPEPDYHVHSLTAGNDLSVGK